MWRIDYPRAYTHESEHDREHEGKTMDANSNEQYHLCIDATFNWMQFDHCVPGVINTLIWGFTYGQPIMYAALSDHDWMYAVHSEVNWIRVLEVACANCDLPVIEWLRTRRDITADTVLASSCRGGNPWTVQWALAHGACAFDDAMSISCCNGHISIAKLMASKGPCNFDRALALACMGGFLDIARWTVERGATNYEWALALACRRHSESAAVWALNRTSNDLNQLLVYAAQTGEYDMALWLIQRGADGSPDEGTLAYSTAIRNGHDDIAHYIDVALKQRKISSLDLY